MTVGIMSAMPEEIDGLLEEMTQVEVTKAGLRTYHRGLLWGTPVVLVLSRCGKVAAATTATYLIEHFRVDRILFTGVAGGIDEFLGVGDVVVAGQLYQHDMDASPLFPRHEVPLLGMSGFPTDFPLRKAALAAVRRFLMGELGQRVSPELLQTFGIDQPCVVEGDIASGDQFVATRHDREQIKKRLPKVCCVEMEGAAVAQVCYEYQVPCAIIRTISDTADESAVTDFPRFIRHIARVYSRGILHHLLTGNFQQSHPVRRRPFATKNPS